MIRRRSSQKKIVVLLLVIILLGGVFFFLRQKTGPTVITIETPASTEELQPETEPEPELPKYPFIDLQPTLNTWASSTRGTSSVVIYDLDNDRLAASHNESEAYFAASLYKLYVAYVGYQKVADGTYVLDEPYLGSFTRGQCLDEMIRTSHSPCAEKMWVELGKENLDTILEGYGLQHTSMTSLRTSAGDVAIVLQRLHKGQDLSEQHTKMLLDSMEAQIYRDALPKGFPATSKVFDKVGFRDYDEYHDVGIVTLENGRSFVVSVLTNGTGTTAIVNLAQAITAQLDTE